MRSVHGPEGDSGRPLRRLREVLEAGKETAIGEMVAEAEQMGADAVIGVDVDYESIQVGHQHADDQRLRDRSQAIAGFSPPMLDRQTYCNPYCNRASTG